MTWATGESKIIEELMWETYHQTNTSAEISSRRDLFRAGKDVALNTEAVIYDATVPAVDQEVQAIVAALREIK